MAYGAIIKNNNMRLVSLNIWHGTLLEELLDFLKKESSNTDIFVFQEMDEWDKPKNVGGPSDRPGAAKSYSSIKTALKDFIAYKSGVYIPQLGTFLSIFVRRTLNVDKKLTVALTGRVKLFGFTTISKLLCLRVHSGEDTFWVCDTHGLLVSGKWREDTPERILQSKSTLSTLSKLDGPKILCGDFNLPPNTETMSMLGKNMDNMITKYDIHNTRSEHYLKNAKYANGAEITDHILVSEGITVKNFEVMKEEVSDHLPLSIEFEIK